MSILQIIVGLGSGFLFGYLTSYFKEKGKNSALLNDLARLTDEKEKISAKYELDIARRKYQYETKKDQYLKYFNLIDEFSAGANNKIFEEFLPVITKFNHDFLHANSNKTKELHATTYFTNEVQKLLLESNKEYLRLKHETGTIKLIAGQTVLSLLEDIDYFSKLSIDKSGELLQSMSSLIINGDHDKLEDLKKDIEAIGMLLNNKKELLIEEVRRELTEI